MNEKHPLLLTNETLTRNYNALSNLIGQSSLELFLTSKLEKAPFFAARHCDPSFEKVLGLVDIDRFLSTIKFRTTECFCVNGNEPIDVSEFATRGVVDSRKALRLYSAGATIILNRVHTYHQPLAELCGLLGKELSAPCQTNVYLTPPSASGLKTHYDTHDVFIIQISGSKTWRVHGVALDLPLAGQGTDANIATAGEPTIETELKEGQVLYIPRGWTHDAVTTSAASLHITLGVFFNTWADAILEYVSYRVLNDSRFRSALPLDFLQRDCDSTRMNAHFRHLISELAASSDAEIARRSLAEQYGDQTQPTTAGLLTQIELLNSIDGETTVQAKGASQHQYIENSIGIEIEVPGGRLHIEDNAKRAAVLCLSGRAIQIKDLLPLLPFEEAQVLVRRLVAAEALEVVAL
jgi:hypothetical protein